MVPIAKFYQGRSTLTEGMLINCTKCIIWARTHGAAKHWQIQKARMCVCVCVCVFFFFAKMTVWYVIRTNNELPTFTYMLPIFDTLPLFMLLSTQFEWETVESKRLDKVRVCKCFLYNLAKVTIQYTRDNNK